MNSTFPAFDFGNIFYYVKLGVPELNPVRVIVPCTEIISNLAPVVGKLGFATVFVNLSIVSEYPVIDSNTGKPIISTKTIPKFSINENVNLEEATSIDQVINIEQIPVKPNNNCEFIIPIGMQFFIFRINLASNISFNIGLGNIGISSGQYFIGLVIPTDYNELSTIFISIYDVIKRKIILQLDNSSFITNFVPNCIKGHNYWTMDYTSPILIVNLQTIFNLLLQFFS